MSSPGFRIRQASEADLDALLALERELVTAPHWSRKAYAAALKAGEFAPTRFLLIAEEDASGRLLGFAAASVAPTGEAELETVGVAEREQRRGIGRSLCRALALRCQNSGATELLLEVRASSVAAQGLYRSMGFAEIGRRPRYYADPEEDAVLMRLSLMEMK